MQKRNKPQKRPYFLIDNNDVYCRMLVEAVIDEAKEVFPEINFGFITGLKDIFKANSIIICGNKNLSRRFFWPLNILNKKIILCHFPKENVWFEKFVKKAKLVINSDDSSPVLLSDVPTQRHSERVWKKERLVSKRGCIGVIGAAINESFKSKFFDSLNLLIEDLDLNIVFISLHGELEKDIIPHIKYSANIRYIEGNKYTPKDLLGIISKIDLAIATDEKGAVCGMSANKPVIGLCSEGSLNKFMDGFAQEEVVFDFSKLSGEELYSKIKIAWVHRAALAEQMQKKIEGLKKKAEESVKKLCKEII
jgi:hypothetical protein